MMIEDTKQVTQTDVAKKAGVSRSVVSYVINNGPRVVSAQTRKRVLKAIKELNYRPNKYAQRLIKEKWDSVADKQLGIVMSNGVLFERPYYGAILAGIQEAAHALHHHIRFIRVFESFKDPVLLNQLVHKHEISGLILLALDQVLETESDYDLLEHILERIPNIVCVDWEYKNNFSINFDRHAAAYQATKHLLKLGHKAITYIGPLDLRLEGFRAAMYEHCLCPTNSSNVSTAVLGYEQAQQCKLKKVSAVVAGTDEVAFGILKYCKDKALQVPDDLAVVSIDNIALSDFAQPPLTTVAVPQKEIGKQAIDILIANKENPKLPNKPMMLPIELVIRESCGSRKALQKHLQID
ncbi:MAG: LacI family DNA-binding transcriptional regulator [Trueperaceae bacterium]|nr:LacI family DNA-binding transcriptional regulator [Trueperaceae bacterium]